jgi:hypothetical protein
MKNLRAAILFFFFFSSLVSCSQTKPGIKNVYAFREVRNRGTMAVDENGKPLTPAVDTLNIIYVETDAQGIIWEHAWKNNKTYNITATQVKERPVEVGKEKGSQKNISINPSKGTQVWILELSPSDDIAPPKGTNPATILLRYKLKGKRIFRTISHQTELWLPDAV